MEGLCSMHGHLSPWRHLKTWHQTCTQENLHQTNSNQTLDKINQTKFKIRWHELQTYPSVLRLRLTIMHWIHRRRWSAHPVDFPSRSFRHSLCLDFWRRDHKTVLHFKHKIACFQALVLRRASQPHLWTCAVTWLPRNWFFCFQHDNDPVTPHPWPWRPTAVPESKVYICLCHAHPLVMMYLLYHAHKWENARNVLFFVFELTCPNLWSKHKG